MLDFNAYQAQALKTAIYPEANRILYPALGLTNEAGEVAGKVKKIIRDGNVSHWAVAKEIGDVLWYAAVLAHDLGFTLEEIAQDNLDKLASRASRGTLKGSGDNR